MDVEENIWRILQMICGECCRGYVLDDMQRILGGCFREYAGGVAENTWWIWQRECFRCCEGKVVGVA